MPENHPDILLLPLLRDRHHSCPAPNCADQELLKAANGLGDAKEAYAPPAAPNVHPSNGVVRLNENKCLLLHCSGRG